MIPNRDLPIQYRFLKGLGYYSLRNDKHFLKGLHLQSEIIQIVIKMMTIKFVESARIRLQ